MSFRASLCFSWWLQWLCRSAYQLGWDEEACFGGYNEEERTDHLKHCETMSSGAICSKFCLQVALNYTGTLR